MKDWFIASRPWSLTASATPVLLGCALAWSQGYSNIFLFILFLLSGMCLHLATNYFNTYGDYISGVDTVESALTCPQLVSGMMKPSQIRNAGFLFLALGIVFGLVILYFTDWLIALFGLIGVVGTLTYTTGKYPFKYYGLGSVFVFFLMGPCLLLPAYYTQTGFMSYSAFILSLPIGFLVSCIMQGNDLRDINFDKNAKIKTLASVIGLEKSLVLYIALNVFAFAIILLSVVTQTLPVSILLSFLVLPIFIKTFKDIKTNANQELIVSLEGLAAQRHFMVGGLLFIGLILSIFLPF